MASPLVSRVMSDTGLPEAQAEAAAAATVAYLMAKLPTAIAEQIQLASDGVAPGPLSRYNTPGFGTLARGMENLRPQR